MNSRALVTSLKNEKKQLFTGVSNELKVNMALLTNNVALSNNNQLSLLNVTPN